MLEVNVCQNERAIFVFLLCNAQLFAFWLMKTFKEQKFCTDLALIVSFLKNALSKTRMHRIFRERKNNNEKNKTLQGYDIPHSVLTRPVAIKPVLPW